MSFSNGPAIVSKGLVFCLDAQDTNSYPGSGTAWNDLAGSNNGTLTNGPTYSNGSIAFDGNNDYVSQSSNVGVTNLSAFSISFWAKRTSGQGSGASFTAYSEGNPSSWPSNLFIFYFGDTTRSNACRVWFGYPTVYNPLIGSTNVMDGNWHYVTYNQTSTSNRTLYVDGSVDATNTTNISHTGTSTTVGAANNNGSRTQFFIGNLAHIACYNRALSLPEILQNYNSQKPRFY
jgi:hypothetical protein